MFALLAALAQQPFYHQGYYNQTFLHPLAAVGVLVAGLMVFVLPRRSALFPFLVLVCFISSAQRIAVAGIDFNLLRILVVCGFLRQAMRGELKKIRWKGMDTALVGWAIVEAAAYIILHDFETSGMIYMAGKMFEALGLYFVIRGFIREWEDAVRLTALFGIICIPIAVFFIVEHQTGRNPFAIFGGVAPITAIREGRMRCNGAFSHPILAGCFFAALYPLAGCRIWSRGARVIGIAGLAGALTVVITSSSSTSWGAAMAGVAGACLFPIRHMMKQVRWAAFGTLFAMHMSMTMPVWHLLARVDLVGGSTGWHRYNLINQCVERWREWAVMGVVSTYNWGIQLFDITNQYVFEAVNGGMGALVMFVAAIVLAFKYVGQMWRAVSHDRELLSLSWALGVCMWVHCVNFIGVSYFGQMGFSWYLILGTITSLSEAVERGHVDRGDVGQGPRAMAADPQAPAEPLLPPLFERGKRRPIPERPSRAPRQLQPTRLRMLRER